MEAPKESTCKAPSGLTFDFNKYKNIGFYFENASEEDIEQNTVDEDEEPIKKLLTGVWLPKGYLPEGRKLTDAEKEKIRTMKFDVATNKYVPRDQPLTDEELACWEEQSLHLKCPISGVHWRDKDAILGVGLFHAPRFLSDEEKARQSATLKRIAKELADKKAASAVNNVDNASTDQSNNEEGLSDDGGEIGEGGTGGGPENELFSVYPKVVAPPQQYIKKLGALPDDVRVGFIEVIVGPVFDIIAYNDGIDGDKEKQIIPRKERGVLDLDQQYNALNFVYQVDKGNGTFERKVCTNRLSFYIDEEHGSRIFPENVESQISLLLYRNSRRFKNDDGTTNQVLLAKGIKKVIPKILKSVVKEVLSEKAGLYESRFDSALRTYCLIHQVSIKLILRYPQAYEYLYRTIIRWVQNPFTEENERSWPDIEEVLIAASLVGIPFSIIRESFIRKLIASLMSNAGVMTDNTQMHDRIKHIFHQNKGLIHRILYIFSFFIAGGSLYELDRKYTRCAGSLPLSERTKMKEAALAVKDVTSFEKFWLTLGMDSPETDEGDVKRHLIKFFAYLQESVPKWQKVVLDEKAFEKIQAPKIVTDSSVASIGIVQFRSEQQRKIAQHLADERKKHEGLPKLNKHGKLDRDHCNFPQCNRKFNGRAHLMSHIKRVFGRTLVFGYHQDHHKLKVKDEKSLECGACHEVFDTIEELHTHFAMLAVPGFWYGTSHTEKLWPNNANNNAAAEAPVAPPPDPFDEPGLCVICMEIERNCVITPCGHFCCCLDCAGGLKTCPICREEVQDVLETYLALTSNMKIFTP